MRSWYHLNSADFSALVLSFADICAKLEMSVIRSADCQSLSPADFYLCASQQNYWLHPTILIMKKFYHTFFKLSIKFSKFSSKTFSILFFAKRCSPKLSKKFFCVLNAEKFICVPQKSAKGKKWQQKKSRSSFLICFRHFSFLVLP